MKLSPILAYTIVTGWASRLACWWIVPSDRVAIGAAIRDATDLVAEFYGIRPDTDEIPIDPIFTLWPIPRKLSAHVAMDPATRLMRIRINYAVVRYHQGAAVIVLAHELAHVLHEQVRGDLSDDTVELSERFAYAVTRHVLNRYAARSYFPPSTPEERKTDCHWRAWKWVQDRRPEDVKAWARGFAGRSITSV